MQNRSLMTLLFALTLGACATPGRNYNTGAVSHRMVSGQEATAAAETRAIQGRAALGKEKAADWPNTFAGMYFTSEEAGSLDIVKPGDSVALRLLGIYVCDFFESNPFPEDVWLFIQDKFMDPRDGSRYPPDSCSRAGIPSSKHYTRGEIVVLADVFEQGPGQGISFQKDGSQPSNARVIYYDDDVRESGQYLSLANLPVYGPITYGGNALFLRLYMLELDDDENAQMSGMLGKLAELGGKAYPPASAVLHTLSSVGGALLSGEQDDLEFRYTMAFDPYDGVSASRLPLAVGTYVIVKQDNRSRDFAWDSQEFDHGSASLKVDDERMRSATYVVMKVTRNEPAHDQDSFQVYADFQATPVAAAPDYSGIRQAAESMGARLRRASLFDRARSLATLLSGPKAPANLVAVAQAEQELLAMICDGVAATATEAAAADADLPGAATRPADAPSPAMPGSAMAEGRLGVREIGYVLQRLSPRCIACPAHGTIRHWETLCPAATQLCGPSCEPQ